MSERRFELTIYGPDMFSADSMSGNCSRESAKAAQKILMGGPTPDALARQLAASEDRARDLQGACVDLSSLNREIEHKMDYFKAFETQLAARNKQLADAVGLLHQWLDMFEGGIKSGDLNELWNATADYVDPTTIEQAKEND